MKVIISRVKVLLAALMVVVLWGCGSTAAAPDMNEEPDYYVEAEDSNTGKPESEENSEPEQVEDVLLTSVYASARVGNTLEFGTYEQDNDLSNGPEPIQWEVVEVKNDCIKVVSCYILDVQSDANDDTTKRYTWKDGKLRAWLNEDFLNTAFDEEEQACIKITSVECSGIKFVPNTDRGWDFDDSFDTGGTTEDKIFIPALNDGDGYPADLGPTEAAKSAGGRSVDYFVRNPIARYSSDDGSLYCTDPCLVSSDKRLSTGSYAWDASRRKEYGVRPVMWLKTK